MSAPSSAGASPANPPVPDVPSTGEYDAWRLVVGACASVVAGWTVIGCGLFLSPSDPVASGELEAGGRFAVNLSVYLPYLALSLVVVLIAAPALTIRALGPGMTIMAAVVTGVFTSYLLTHGWLAGVRPFLWLYLLVALGLQALGLMLALKAATTEPGQPA